MKLPEPLFVIINPIMRTLLRSPIHGLLSRSLMLITFTGRKSGRQFTTPVRYVVQDGVVRCFTSKQNLWWRNLRGGANVTLRISGRDQACRAIAIEDDPATIKSHLSQYLAVFPQDAAYHDIRLGPGKKLVEEDLERASSEAVVVEARSLEQQ
jgi:hypothetical protein